MRYMLDTHICSYLIKQRPVEILSVMQAKVEAGSTLCISAITYAELLFGVERSGNPDKHLALIREFVDRLDEVLPWDDKAAECFSGLHAKLLSQGTPIANNDTMIAGHCKSAGTVLVTNNERHFKRVPDLEIENWVKEPSN